MNIPYRFISPVADSLIRVNCYAERAYFEVEDAILQNHTVGSTKFEINSSAKNCNGVVPVKEPIYEMLEFHYLWFREKPLQYFKDTQKGGPIDVYKEFSTNSQPFNVGLEFETGNISSAHRSMNKLRVGIKHGDLDMAFLIMPVKQLAYYLMKLDSDTFYVHHIAAVMVDNFGRLLIGVNLSDKAVQDLNLARVGFLVQLVD